jgi:hypothetical protein
MTKKNYKKLYTVLSYLGVFTFCTCCIQIVSRVLLIVLSCLVCNCCWLTVGTVVVVYVCCYLMCICCTLCELLFFLLL